MKYLLLWVIAGSLLAFSAPVQAALIPLTETNLFGPLPGNPIPALASVAIHGSDDGRFTFTVFANEQFLQWGGVFDEFYFQLNPARGLLGVTVADSVGGEWQLSEDAPAARFGDFAYALKGHNLGEGQGTPLIFQLDAGPGLEIADLLWNNDLGWSLVTRLSDPLNQSSLYLAAVAPRAVPLPSALLLMTTGLVGLMGVKRKVKG